MSGSSLLVSDGASSSYQVVIPHSIDALSTYEVRRTVDRHEGRTPVKQTGVSASKDDKNDCGNESIINVVSDTSDGESEAKLTKGKGGIAIGTKSEGVAVGDQHASGSRLEDVSCLSLIHGYTSMSFTALTDSSVHDRVCAEANLEHELNRFYAFTIPLSAPHAVKVNKIALTIMHGNNYGTVGACIEQEAFRIPRGYNTYRHSMIIGSGKGTIFSHVSPSTMDNSPLESRKIDFSVLATRTLEILTEIGIDTNVRNTLIDLIRRKISPCYALASEHHEHEIFADGYTHVIPIFFTIGHDDETKQWRLHNADAKVFMDILKHCIDHVPFMKAFTKKNNRKFSIIRISDQHNMYPVGYAWIGVNIDNKMLDIMTRMRYISPQTSVLDKYHHISNNVVCSMPDKIGTTVTTLRRPAKSMILSEAYDCCLCSFKTFRDHFQVILGNHYCTSEDEKQCVVEYMNDDSYYYGFPYCVNLNKLIKVYVVGYSAQCLETTIPQTMVKEVQSPTPLTYLNMNVKQGRQGGASRICRIKRCSSSTRTRPRPARPKRKLLSYQDITGLDRMDVLGELLMQGKQSNVHSSTSSSAQAVDVLNSGAYNEAMYPDNDDGTDGMKYLDPLLSDETPNFEMAIDPSMPEMPAFALSPSENVTDSQSEDGAVSMNQLFSLDD